MRIVTRETAFAPETWTPAKAAEVAALFNGLAAGWDARMSGDETRVPLLDALDRGGSFGPRCLEVGAGTGLGTKVLASRFATVVALDLSEEMLRHFGEPEALRVHADAARLPFGAGLFDVVVLINAFLFPSEVVRVLAADGAVIWISTLGEDTPIYLPASDVDQCLGVEWNAVASEAGWSTWSVHRRSQ
jgi:ubiquinone/menaquinone biosynthesis C-methylase UbiE